MYLYRTSVNNINKPSIETAPGIVASFDSAGLWATRMIRAETARQGVRCVRVQARSFIFLTKEIDSLFESNTAQLELHVFSKD